MKNLRIILTHLLIFVFILPTQQVIAEDNVQDATELQEIESAQLEQAPEQTPKRTTKNIRTASIRGESEQKELEQKELEYAPGQLIVKLNEGKTIEDIAELNAKYNVTSTEKVFKDIPKPEDTLDKTKKTDTLSN